MHSSKTESSCKKQNPPNYKMHSSKTQILFRKQNSSYKKQTIELEKIVLIENKTLLITKYIL